VVAALRALKVVSCLIDGELVVCDDAGVSSFERLRSRQHDHIAFVYAFDLLALAGQDLRFVSHRPIWGIGKNFTLNETLQQALKSSDGKLPEGIDLALAGHMHTFEILTFSDKRSPQFIIGTGGTDLDKKIKRPLAGTKIGGTTVNYGRVDREWGFALFTPHKNGTDWTLTFFTAKGKARFACKVKRTEATCG
jgi:hypothetical protein